MSKSKKSSNKIFGIDRTVFASVGVALIVGFFLGAQYMKSANFVNTQEKSDTVTKVDMSSWEKFTVKPNLQSKGYTLQVPPESACNTIGEAPPITFGSEAPAGDYCFFGIYTNGDEYPYGLVIEYTFLPKSSAKQGLFKEEFSNGIKSDIDFGDPEAVMMKGNKTISGKEVVYTRYVFNGGDDLWHMFTIETDSNSTNLDLYKQILSTFKVIE